MRPTPAKAANVRHCSADVALEGLHAAVGVDEDGVALLVQGAQGGDFSGERDYARFVVGRGEVIPAVEEGVRLDEPLTQNYQGGQQLRVVP